MVAGLCLFGIRHELKKQAQKKREVAYQSALSHIPEALKTGTTRKEVEDYLRAKNAAFSQMCCVGESANGTVGTIW